MSVLPFSAPPKSAVIIPRGGRIAISSALAFSAPLNRNHYIIMVWGAAKACLYAFLTLLFLATLFGTSNASLGDHLPEFKECVKVRIHQPLGWLHSSFGQSSNSWATGLSGRELPTWQCRYT